MAMRRAASRLARLASVDPSRAWSAAPRALASVPCSLSRPREFSHKPEQSVYGGPKPASERVTLRKLAGKYRRGERISVVTAYDYPSAVHVDLAGVDVCLVGDSAAMVVHGHDTTLPITLDEMLSHCRSVARGASRPLLVGDLPFGSYEKSPSQAVEAATRMLKEGGMDAVKLEGGDPARVAAAKAVVDAGVACMGHVGLTPQSISVLGGFRPQGRTHDEASAVVERALALEKAGCFAIVLECVPAAVAAATTAALRVPTVGIGAGPECSGQVLVYHDLLGFTQHPHHAKVTPKFCKQYAAVGEVITGALRAFREDVESGAFPSRKFSPYRVEGTDADRLVEALRERGLVDAAHAAARVLEEERTG